jgi:thioredoxin 1
MREIAQHEIDFIEDVQNGTFIVDFWASWCPPCKAMEPILHSIDSEGLASVLKIDADVHMELAQKYNVRSLPTMLIFKDGVEIERIVGAISKNDLISRL